MTALGFLLVALPLGFADESASVRHEADPRVNALLAPIREKHELPGIVGGILVGDKLVAVGVVGARKTGAPEKFTVDDRVHFGSDTKAMTATRIAMLVEQGKLKWDSTLASVFPDLKGAMHAEYRDVTLAELLTHRAGLPMNPASWWDLGSSKPTTEQRLTLLKQVLKNPPETKPGTKFEYSNVGYGLAAAMAERVAKSSWEDLMRDGLFKPLKMTSAGFGPPGRKGKVEQPWGHGVENGELKATQTDNAPAIGPAGTVHCSLPDWAKFVALHVQGEQGNGRLLKAESFRYLHEPPKGQDFAFGWASVHRDWARGQALTHGGSNTMWYAVVWIAPKRNFAVLVATNRGGKEGTRACDDASAALIEFFEKHFAQRQ